jgi:flagellar protein FlgJ
MVSRVDTQSVYTDLSGLNAITQLGRENTPEAMRQVAQQFESVFLGIVLKAMRDSNAVFSEGNYLQSNEMDFHQENFDNQLTLHMSEGQGLGLADVLFEQMMGQYGLDRPDGTGPAPRRDWPVEQPRVLRDGMALAGNERRPAAENGPVPGQLSRAVPAPAPASAEPAAGAVTFAVRASEAAAVAISAAPVPTRSFAVGRTHSPRDFVHSLYPIAEEVAGELGMDPRVLLAQSALETGWGRKLISRADGTSSHNLFGIKADSRWEGERATVSTVEYRDGVARLEKANFRSYDSFEESFRDYVKFLQENPRYQQALSASHNPETFAQRLQDAGYATDPVYAKKISRVMNSKTMQLALAELRGTLR